MTDDPKITLTVGSTEVSVAAPEQPTVASDSNPFADATEEAGLEQLRTRYRDTLKWILSAFAAVGTLLVAGLSIGGLRDIEGADFAVAVVGIGLVALGVILVVGMAARGMSPAVVSFAAIAHADIGSPGLAASLAKDFKKSSLLGKYATFADFERAYAANDEYAQNLGVGRIRPWVRFYIAKHLFQQAVAAIIVGVLFVTAGTVLFASRVGGSQTKSDTATATAPETAGDAVPVVVDFTTDGRKKFGDSFPASCLGTNVLGLATAGAEKDGYDIVTVGQGACEPMHMFVTPELARVARTCPIKFAPLTTTSIAHTSAFKSDETPSTKPPSHDLCAG